MCLYGTGITMLALNWHADNMTVQPSELWFRVLVQSRICKCVRTHRCWQEVVNDCYQENAPTRTRVRLPLSRANPYFFSLSLSVFLLYLTFVAGITTSAEYNFVKWPYISNRRLRDGCSTTYLSPNLCVCSRLNYSAKSEGSV